MFANRYLFFFVLFLLLTPFAFSEPLSGKRSVLLLPATGEPFSLGSIEFKKNAGGIVKYSLELDESKFGNHFLSMRPFKCFSSPKQMLCHLPYPYEKTQTISSKDLQDLEYDLLFIHRKETDYAIDPWNGIYYKLTLAEDGGLTGVLKEVDLDILAAPPDDGVRRPITATHLNDADPDSHSYPGLVIK